MIRKTLLALICAVCALGAFAQKNDKGGKVEFPPARKLAFVQQIIEQYYVDSVNGNKIANEAIVAMLKTLDPHSTYTDADATRALTEPLQGNFSGIGIQFNMLDDTIRVIQTVAGGPSEKVGIIAGDRILSANDTLLSGVKMPQADVVKKLRGPKGSKVAIKVARKGTAEPIEFNIVRDDIPTYSVNAAYMANDSTGYIKVTLFGETTPKEVRQALDKLYRQGMRHLILDLEDNGGGYLMAACELAGMFLEPGELVVYTEGLNAQPSQYYNTVDKRADVGRLVVTVNQFSASASEILSGAVQDQDRGLVVGRRTFGKGLVQRPFPFPDGSMIRLTTARYHTPSGRCIQKPYTAGDEDDYNADILHRYNSGELNSADSVHFDESLLRHTLKLNRPVYGGGGIMPDRFVPIDTTYYSTYYRDILAKGVLHKYCNNYIDSLRPQLKKLYPNESKFVSRFAVTPAMINSLVALAAKDGIAPDSAQLAVSEPALEVYIKALIGRDLFEQSTYHLVANSINPVYQAALELIDNPAEYSRLLSEPKEPEVVFEDNFDGTSAVPDTTKWKVCRRFHPDWARHLSESFDQAYVKDGKLVLVAEKKDGKYLTGGIETRGKFDFTYGKAEARCRFTAMPQGNWSAWWLMPTSDPMWPEGGEIDIMEHLNGDSIVYQTIHSHFKNNLGRENPKGGYTAPVDPTEWNTYGVEWTPDEIIFTVNGKETFRYPNLKLENEVEMKQWPFNTPFYLILNQSLGGENTWAGPIDDAALPAIMEVDWIRVTRTK